MALHREHAGLVVQLLGHVLTNAPHHLPAAAGGVLRFVMHFAARQVGRQDLPLGLLLVLGSGLGGLVRLDLCGQCGQIGVQCLVKQALLLGCEAFALRGELQAFEHRHFVRELVDQGRLVTQLHHQQLHRLAQLRLAHGVQMGVNVFCCDHVPIVPGLHSFCIGISSNCQAPCITAP